VDYFKNALFYFLVVFVFKKLGPYCNAFFIASGIIVKLVNALDVKFCFFCKNKLAISLTLGLLADLLYLFLSIELR